MISIFVGVLSAAYFQLIKAQVASTLPTKVQADIFAMAVISMFPVKMTPEEQKDAVAKYAPETGESLLRKGG